MIVQFVSRTLCRRKIQLCHHMKGACQSLHEISQLTTFSAHELLQTCLICMHWKVSTDQKGATRKLKLSQQYIFQLLLNHSSPAGGLCIPELQEMSSSYRLMAKLNALQDTGQQGKTWVHPICIALDKC